MKKHFADDVSVAELYDGISYISTGELPPAGDLLLDLLGQICASVIHIGSGRKPSHELTDTSSNGSSTTNVIPHAGFLRTQPESSPCAAR
jgi:hypothetical protein